MKDYLIERKKIILVGLLVMLATSIPYLIGYASQGDDWQFTGFVIGVEDGNSYIAKMLTGAEGKWLFRSPYSAEQQAGVVAFFPYLIMGKLTAGNAQHEQLVALYHLYRIVAGVLATLATYDFVSIFIKRENHRLWALFGILLGGGFGWVITIAGLKNFLGSIPLDFLSPESFGFLGLLGIPHLVAARALLFWGLKAYLENKSAIKAGLIWLLMGFFQPMNVVLVWVVACIHGLTEISLDYFRGSAGIKEWAYHTSYMKKAFVAVLVSSPIVIYTALSFYRDPYLAAWASQNRLPSPHWVHYLIAYGLVLPFAVSGVIKIYRHNPKQGLLLACWIAVLPLLVYAPVNPQRRLAEGIWVILITGMFGCFLNKKAVPTHGKLITGLSFPSALFLVWGAVSRAVSPSAPIFISAPEVEAYNALDEIASKDSIVLSTFAVGNSMPAWVPVRVIQGHGPETVHLKIWQAAIDEYFLENQGDTHCGGFFEENHIDYLFWGPEEVGTWDWDPGIKDCLLQVYNAGGYRIYQVVQ